MTCDKRSQLPTASGTAHSDTIDRVMAISRYTAVQKCSLRRKTGGLALYACVVLPSFHAILLTERFYPADSLRREDWRVSFEYCARYHPFAGISLPRELPCISEAGECFEWMLSHSSPRHWSLCYLDKDELDQPFPSLPCLVDHRYVLTPTR